MERCVTSTRMSLHITCFTFPYMSLTGMTVNKPDKLKVNMSGRLQLYIIRKYTCIHCALYHYMYIDFCILLHYYKPREGTLGKV